MFSYTIFVLILHVHCVVASMSMLTIPISKWGTPVMIRGM